MQIVTRTQGVDLTWPLERFTYSQLESALRAFRDMVVSIDVCLKDVNGPKGGVDKQVLVMTKLRTGQVISIESKRSSLHSAIAASARRSKRTVRRALQKFRRIEKIRWQQLHFDGQIDGIRRRRVPVV